MKKLGNIEYKKGWIKDRNPQANKLHNKFSYAEKNGLKIGFISPEDLGEVADFDFTPGQLDEMNALQARDILKKELFANRDTYSPELVEVMEYCIFHLRENRKLTESTIKEDVKRFGPSGIIIPLFEMANSLDNLFEKITIEKEEEEKDQLSKKDFANTGVNPSYFVNITDEERVHTNEKEEEDKEEKSIIETNMKAYFADNFKAFQELIDIAPRVGINPNWFHSIRTLPTFSSMEEAFQQERLFAKSCARVTKDASKDFIQQLMFKLPSTASVIAKAQSVVDFNNEEAKNVVSPNPHTVVDSKNLNTVIRDYPNKKKTDLDPAEKKVADDLTKKVVNRIDKDNQRMNHIQAAFSNYNLKNFPAPAELFQLVSQLSERLMYSFVRIESFIMVLYYGIQSYKKAAIAANKFDDVAKSNFAQMEKGFENLKAFENLYTIKKSIGNTYAGVRISYQNLYNISLVSKDDVKTAEEGLNWRGFLNKIAQIYVWSQQYLNFNSMRRLILNYIKADPKNWNYNLITVGRFRTIYDKSKDISEKIAFDKDRRMENFKIDFSEFKKYDFLK